MSTYPDLILERGMPASPDAERSILGAILLENAHHHEAAEKRLTPEDFALDSHRRIFARMNALIGEGRAVDLVTLVEELARRKEVESVGGVAYIASLTEGLPRRLSIAEYVGIVREKSQLRRTIVLCSAIANRALDQSETADALIAEADRELLDITAEQSLIEDSIEAQSLREFEVIKSQRKRESYPAYSTGIEAFDMLTGGIRIGQLTVLGGRPGVGKSALAEQIAQRCCQRGIPTHVFAVEMTSGEMLRRLWASEADVPFWKLQDPTHLSDSEMERLTEAMLRVSQWPLQIDESDVLTPDQLLARARVVKRQKNTGLIVVDYLQKLEYGGQRRDRSGLIDDFLRRFAALLKGERIAGLMLSSLTENDKKNYNIPPTMHDFRDCGDIKFHAHVAALLHREYEEDLAELKRAGELTVAKNRGGRTGICAIEYDPNTMHYVTPERGLYDR